MPKPKKKTKKQTSASASPQGKSIREIYKNVQKDYPSEVAVDFYDPGSFALSNALGGGLPKGKVIEFFGPAGIGKSTVALHAAHAMCEAGHDVLCLDPEFAVTQSLMDGVGVSEYYGDKFFFHRPKTFAAADELMEDYMGCGEPPALVILDSITALVPRKRMEVNIEDVEPGLQARLQGNLLAKYKGSFAEANCTWLLINQIRTKMEARAGGRGWDVKKDAAGGFAMKFYPDVRVEMGKKKRYLMHVKNDPTTIYGCDFLVRTIKNKCAPMSEAVLSVLFGQGISNIRAMAMYLKATDCIKDGTGSWFHVDMDGQEVKLQGWSKLCDWVGDNFDAVEAYLKKEGVLL